MLLKLRVLLVGITVLSLFFGGVAGRYLEDDSLRFPDPYQMGPVAEFRAYSNLVDALERRKEHLKEVPEYDILQKSDPVYIDQPDDNNLFENLPKPVEIASNPAVQRIPHRNDRPKKNGKNLRKACKFNFLEFLKKKVK